MGWLTLSLSLSLGGLPVPDPTGALPAPLPHRCLRGAADGAGGQQGGFRAGTAAPGHRGERAGGGGIPHGDPVSPIPAGLHALGRLPGRPAAEGVLAGGSGEGAAAAGAGQQGAELQRGRAGGAPRQQGQEGLAIPLHLRRPRGRPRPLLRRPQVQGRAAGRCDTPVPGSPRVSPATRLQCQAGDSAPGPQSPWVWGSPAPSPWDGGTGVVAVGQGCPQAHPNPPRAQNNTIFEKVLEVTVKDVWRPPNSEFGAGRSRREVLGRCHRADGPVCVSPPLQTEGWGWAPCWASPSEPSSSGRSSPPGSGTSTRTPVSTSVGVGAARGGPTHVPWLGIPPYSPVPILLYVPGGSCCSQQRIPSGRGCVRRSLPGVAAVPGVPVKPISIPRLIGAGGGRGGGASPAPGPGGSYRAGKVRSRMSHPRPALLAPRFVFLSLHVFLPPPPSPFLSSPFPISPPRW